MLLARLVLAGRPPAMGSVLASMCRPAPTLRLCAAPHVPYIMPRPITARSLIVGVDAEDERWKCPECGSPATKPHRCHSCQKRRLAAAAVVLRNKAI